MTGPEHYREAEKYLSVLDLNKDAQAWANAVRSGEVALALQAAHAHATLALAAATAMNDGSGGMGDYDWDAWREVASAGWKSEGGAS